MSDATAEPKTETGLLEDLRALIACPRELWLVYLATFLEYMGIFSFLPTVTLWLSGDFGMEDKEAGWWAATFSMMATLFVFLVGALADFIGVRTTLIISFTLAALARLAMSMAPTRGFAIAALLSFAFAYATTSPVLQTAVQRTSTRRTRAFAFSFWYVSFNLAGALSGPMIDLVRSKFLNPATKKLVPHPVNLPLLGPHVMSAHAVILGLGFLFAVAAVLVILTLRKGFEDQIPLEDQEVGGPSKKVNPLIALKGAFMDSAFWKFMALLALLCLVRMMFQHMHFTWPKYITREQGEDFPVGTVWSLNSLLILVLAPLGTALTRKRRPFEVLLFGAFISSMSPFVLCFGSSMTCQILMVITLTIGEALWSPRIYEYNLSIAPRGRESMYVSLAALPYFLAKFLVGPTSGYLLSKYCPEKGIRQSAIMWGIIGITTMLGPVGILSLRRWIVKNEATPTAASA